MRRANLHPNPLSGYSEDYPDDEDDAFLEDDEPDALCTDCGDDVFCTDRHFTEGFEWFGSILCEGCFNERREEEGDDPTTQGSESDQ